MRSGGAATLVAKALLEGLVGAPDKVADHSLVKGAAPGPGAPYPVIYVLPEEVQERKSRQNATSSVSIRTNV